MEKGGVIVPLAEWEWEWEWENAVSAAVAVSTQSHLSDVPATREQGHYAHTLLDRGFPPREALPLPNKPPYTAHLGNLSFDATEGDVQDFFSGCSVTSVRIVEDKMERKPKGFGYVEFSTLDGLKKALDLNSTQFQGRNIRISVAEPREFPSSS